jgi:uncharacterized repeat protein (TIGR01451 family)
MQKKKTSLTVIASFIFFASLWAQEKKLVYYPSHNFSKGTGMSLKRLKHPSGTPKTYAALAYFYPDSIYTSTNKGETYWNNLLQPINSRYSLKDTGTQQTNTSLLHSCTVVFDTLIDANTNYVYPINKVQNVNIDSIIIGIAHKNTTGTNDTMVVQINSVDANDYPTNNVLWSTSIITDTSYSYNNSLKNTYGLTLHPNYSLVGTNKYCVTLEYYGSTLDTMEFVFGYPSYNTCGGTAFADTTSIGHKYATKFAANSYTTGWQYFMPLNAIATLPTRFGSDTVIYPCANGIDTTNYPLFFQDIAIFSLVSFNSSYTGISGTAYVDENGDCTYDVGDVPVPYAALKAVDSLNNTVSTAYSDYNGNYTLDHLNKGSHYRIEIDSTAGTGYTMSSLCNNSGIDSILVLGPTQNNNIAITCPGGASLAGYLNACIDTPSFGQVEVSACVYSNGCLPTNATLKLVIDTAIHISMSGITADTLPIVHGDTLIWNYKNLPYSTIYTCVCMKGTIDNLPAGDSVHLQMIIDPINTDSLPGSNVTSYWAPVFPHNCIGLPYDPNGKTVSPIGNITTDQRLTYNVHFQNTGTAPAHNVVVIDTLSTKLDITTLQIVSSSSPMSLQVNNGNILNFEFDNINLPDTGTSKTASIGNVIYTVKPLNNLTGGEQITNTAGIYFDANSPVYTNTTISTISNGVTGIKPVSQLLNLNCFPNPFTTSTSIIFNTDNKHYLEVDDITGRKIETFECSCKEYTLQRNNLAPGIYIIKAFDQEQKFIATAKIVVE